MALKYPGVSSLPGTGLSGGAASSWGPPIPTCMECTFKGTPASPAASFSSGPSRSAAPHGEGGVRGVCASVGTSRGCVRGGCLGGIPGSVRAGGCAWGYRSAGYPGVCVPPAGCAWRYRDGGIPCMVGASQGTSVEGPRCVRGGTPGHPGPIEWNRPPSGCFSPVLAPLRAVVIKHT